MRTAICHYHGKTRKEIFYFICLDSRMKKFVKMKEKKRKKSIYKKRVSDTLLMPWLHLHVKAYPVRATWDNFREIDWNVAISWQLWGLRGCYGFFMAVTGSTSCSFSRKSHCVAYNGTTSRKATTRKPSFTSFYPKQKHLYVHALDSGWLHVTVWPRH